MALEWSAWGMKRELSLLMNSSPQRIFHGMIVPHQFRHTYATEMLRAGVSFLAVMKLLGHTSPEMTMRYLDVALPICNGNSSWHVPNLGILLRSRGRRSLPELASMG
jgi:integrase-like protein